MMNNGPLRDPVSGRIVRPLTRDESDGLLAYLEFLGGALVRSFEEAAFKWAETAEMVVAVWPKENS
jgi:hypothetical protein